MDCYRWVSRDRASRSCRACRDEPGCEARIVPKQCCLAVLGLSDKRTVITTAHTIPGMGSAARSTKSEPAWLVIRTRDIQASQCAAHRVPPSLGGTLRECGSASLVSRRHLIISNAGISLIRLMRCTSLRIPCLVSGSDILWRIVRCHWIRC